MVTGALCFLLFSPMFCFSTPQIPVSSVFKMMKDRQISSKMCRFKQWIILFFKHQIIFLWLFLFTIIYLLFITFYYFFLVNLCLCKNENNSQFILANNVCLWIKLTSNSSFSPPPQQPLALMDDFLNGCQTSPSFRPTRQRYIVTITSRWDVCQCQSSHLHLLLQERIPLGQRWRPPPGPSHRPV